MLLTFTNGDTRAVDDTFAHLVVGLDADGDLLIPLGDGIAHDDGTPYYVPLTWCCYASGKGSANVPSGVCCRACYRDVGPKYGGSSDIATPVVSDADATVS